MSENWSCNHSKQPIVSGGTNTRHDSRPEGTPLTTSFPFKTSPFSAAAVATTDGGAAPAPAAAATTVARWQSHEEDTPLSHRQADTVKASPNSCKIVQIQTWNNDERFTRAKHNVRSIYRSVAQGKFGELTVLLKFEFCVKFTRSSKSARTAQRHIGKSSRVCGHLPRLARATRA